MQFPSRARRQPYIGCLNAFAQSHQATTLQMLSDDILLLIISFVEVRDVLIMRQTSKRLFTLSKLRWVWHNAIKRHILDRGLPIPAGGTDLKMLSAEQLEARAVHAAKFHDNWCSANPTARHTLSFSADQYLPEETLESHKSTVSHIAFLPGCSGQFLVTVVGRIITCWEVPFDGSGAYRIADYVSPLQVEQLVINEDSEAEGTLAYLTGSPAQNDPAVVVALSLDKFHGQFLEISRLRSVRGMAYPLHTMHGSYVVLGNAPTIWYYQGPIEAVSLHSSHPLAQIGEIRAVKIVNRYMVVVRENCMQFIYAPVWRGRRTAWSGQPQLLFQLSPTAIEAIIIHRNAGTEQEDMNDWPSTPVTVLLRCREDGIEMIVQFDLLPGSNKFAQSSAEEASLPSSLLPFARCRRVNAIPVPPSCRKLHASSSGKGFCIQTRHINSRQSSYPARCLLGFHVTARSVVAPMSSEGTGKGEQPKATYLGNDVQYSEKPFYSRRCDMSEIIQRKYAIVSTAFEDTAGRIAIGDRHGQVEVLDFA
ncbi:hypothetical protein EVJ58_g8065 [Rhodofomes roseus]|nr:hypothetical protein EVJ58_g8065 [Rhodofomes roseus]